MGLPIESSQGISAASIQGMDLETAMMAVQSNRANLLETQMKDQMASVQLKNDKVSTLNSVMGQLNSALSKLKADAKPGTRLIDQGTDAAERVQEGAERTAITAAFKAAGLNPLELMPSGRIPNTNDFDINLVSKTEFDSAVTNLKGNIDSLSNSQQMDMLRLQSLSNKRNEAFDLMSNFVKKMQDNRSSIIGNMR